MNIYMKQLIDFKAEDMKLLLHNPLSYMFRSAAQHKKGMLFVNEMEDDHTMIFQLENKIFVGGEPTVEALRQIEILGWSMAPIILYFFYPDEKWRTSFMDTKISKGGSLWMRRLYGVKPANSPMPQERPEVVKITKSLIDSDIGNKGMIYDEVTTYVDFLSFLEQGIGYALIVRNEVIGFCTSEYQNNKEMAIGIEVEGEFQRQGFAKCMTQHFLYDASLRGFKVFWECFEDNYPSNQAALSCGFKKLADYPIIEVDLS